MQPVDILLATLNAKFIHCAFGLRYLHANLGALQPRAALVEFEIQQRPLEIVEQLLARRPRIIGLGVYIWNVRETTEVVSLLKRLAPEVIVILGGPEVSYEWEEQEIVRLADHVITGEADVKFAEVCAQLLKTVQNPADTACKPDLTANNPIAAAESAIPEQVIIPTAAGALPPSPKTEAVVGKMGAGLTRDAILRSPDTILRTEEAILRTPDAILCTEEVILRTPDAVLRTGDGVLPTEEGVVSAESAVLPHPSPLPLGEGTAIRAAGGQESELPATTTGHRELARSAILPLPAGEGRGEGENVPSPAKPLPSQGTLPKIIPAELPKLEDIALPYDLYTDHDLAHRVVYVEASRGCPFTCEFCLSSLDIPVRQLPLEKFLAAMEGLLARGATQFKFVDRTFNLNLLVSRAILQFFLARMRPGLFVHFEMVPDRLPEALRAVIAQFPAGSLQFEVGVQTFDDQASRNISRRQDHAKLAENLTWLRSHTGVHVHADLIVGLPGEDLASFARGFDRLVALGPQEIQVGILKRLRGTPIVRHDSEFQMRYSGHPPYELLCNRELDFPTMQRLRRFARYWDLVANSGNFCASTPMLWAAAGNCCTQQEAGYSLPHPSPLPLGEGATQSAIGNAQRSGQHDARSAILPLPAGEGRGEGESALHSSELSINTPGQSSPFWSFLAFSDWLFARLGKRHGIALVNLAEALFDYLVSERKANPALVTTALRADFDRTGRRERPAFMQEKSAPTDRPAAQSRAPSAPKRQSRHTAPPVTAAAAAHPESAPHKT